jgi:hypothetical protein
VLLGGTATLSSAVYWGSICADWYTKTYGTFAAKTITGTGDQVIAVPAKGGYFTAKFTGSNGASSWFSVTATDKNGVAAGAPMSGLGASFSGASGWGLAQPVAGNATASLQVRARGSWSITLHRVADAPVLPASGAGDGVYRYDGTAGSWTITGSSSASAPLFDVRQHSQASRFSVLVGSSARSYSGRVGHTAGPSVVQVLSNGSWTIR